MNLCDLAYISLQDDRSVNKNGDLGAHDEARIYSTNGEYLRRNS